MIQLFAALDVAGELRFIGEVKRGLECACTCPTCGAPVVARQGDQVDWHFSHAAGGERPECIAGALNLLRRLSLDYLHSLARLPRFEPYARVVPGALSVHTALAKWECQPNGVTEWLEPSTQDAPVALLELPQSRRATLHVVTDPAQRGERLNLPGLVGRAAFFCPMPSLAQLRNRSQVMAHMGSAGRFFWMELDDLDGVYARALQQVEHAARARQAQAGRYWAGVRQRATERPTEIPAQPPRPPVSPDRGGPGWAFDRKPNATFQFRRLRDGTRWVLYQSNSHGQLLVPYPGAFEGWDEFFPSRLATPLNGTTALQVQSFDGLLMFFRERAEVVRITGNEQEFAGL